MMITQPERQRRAALVKSLRISYAEDVYARNREQSFDESRNERRFIRPSRAVRGQQGLTAFFHRPIAMPPKFRNVIDRRRNSRDQFLNLRPGLPAFGRGVRRRSHFVRLEPFQVLLLAIQGSHVRPKELVRRARQKIAVERLYVNRPV